jgi:hypothetical protein
LLYGHFDNIGSTVQVTPCNLLHKHFATDAFRKWTTFIIINKMNFNTGLLCDSVQFFVAVPFLIVFLLFNGIVPWCRPTPRCFSSSMLCSMLSSSSMRCCPTLLMLALGFPTSSIEDYTFDALLPRNNRYLMSRLSLQVPVTSCIVDSAAIYIMVFKMRNTICPPPPQLSLHKLAALTSNSNGTRSVYNRKNPKSSLYRVL